MVVFYIDGQGVVGHNLIVIGSRVECVWVVGHNLFGCFVSCKKDTRIWAVDMRGKICGSYLIMAVSGVVGHNLDVVVSRVEGVGVVGHNLVVVL